MRSSSKSDRYPFRILDDLIVVPWKDLVRSGEETGCRMERP